jgi:hypothetical protein
VINTERIDVETVGTMDLMQPDPGAIDDDSTPSLEFGVPTMLEQRTRREVTVEPLSGADADRAPVIERSIE